VVVSRRPAGDVMASSGRDVFGHFVTVGIGTAASGMDYLSHLYCM
jgi:hypothetical protein